MKLKTTSFFTFFLKSIVLTLLVVGLYSCNSNSKPDTFHGLKLDPTNDSLTLPANFGLTIVAEGIGKARHMFVRDNGDIYVNLQSTIKDSSLVY